MAKTARGKGKQGRVAIEPLFEAPVTEKEKAIIEAAVALIGQRGIDGATTAEIARHAGVTERTLFRYFPSKQDLVRRVLLPLLVQGGIARQWEALEAMFKTEQADLKAWYVAAAKARFEQVSKNPVRTRTVMTELVQNSELRDAMSALWRQHIWQPMVQHLKEMQAAGEIRAGIDVEVLAHMIHFLQAGYFLARHVFAPGGKWDDAKHFEQMGEILSRGASGR
jgi:TetR/AcrR family transcriptional regulator